jgi:hypothetical protein
MQCDATVGSNQRNGSRAAARSITRFTLLVSSLLGASPALAASPDVRTTAQGCSGYDAERLDELLAIETATIAAEHAARPSDVRLSCRDAVVTVHVSLRDGTGERSSVVDPGTADRAARTRLLALTITELLADLWRDAPAPPEALPKEAPPVDERPAKPASARPPSWVLHGGAAVRSMLDPRTGLLGGTLGVAFRASPYVAIGVDVEGLFGSARSEHADVGVTLVSTAVHAVFGPRIGDVTLGAGPGARLGVVRFSPTVDEANTVGHDVSGPWAGPFALAVAQWTKAHFAVRASLELGVATWPFVGTVNGQAEELALRGVWFGGTVGAGAAF